MTALPPLFATIGRRLGLTLSIAWLMAAIVFTGSVPATAQEATPTTSDCNVEQATADAAAVYAIASDQSTASYTAKEELRGIGDNDAVGTTNAIIGSVLLGDDNVPLRCSNFAVDMRTMETDEARRDNYLRQNVLESDTYPYATFLVDSVTGLDGGLVDGETVKIQLHGDLTIHGVTKPVTWEAEVTLKDETITGTATTTFKIEDFDMEKPIVGPVVSIDDSVKLDVSITAPLNKDA